MYFQPKLLPKGSSKRARSMEFSKTKYRKFDIEKDLQSTLSETTELQCFINVISSSKQDKLSAPHIDGKCPT